MRTLPDSHPNLTSPRSSGAPMTTLRFAAFVTLLVFATVGWAAPPEPAGVKGYITWTDPATSKKHLVMGTDARTGVMVYAEESPVIHIRFSGGNPLDPKNVLRMASPSVWAPVDTNGRALPTGRVNWVGANIPVAFRYSIAFLQDTSWKNLPVILPDGRSIKYNPILNQFLEVLVEVPFDKMASVGGAAPRFSPDYFLRSTGINVPLEDFPEKFPYNLSKLSAHPVFQY